MSQLIDTTPRYVKTTTGEIDLEFLGHSDAQSFDLEAGFPLAHLHYADLYHVHRDTIRIFAELFTPFLEKISGLPRGIDEKKTQKVKARAVNPNKVTPIREGFTPYLARVWAKSSKDQQAQIRIEGLRLSQTIRINVAPAAANAPIEEMYFKRADSILESDLETINEKCSRWQSIVPDFELARDQYERPVRDSLARLLQKFDAARWANED